MRIGILTTSLHAGMDLYLKLIVLPNCDPYLLLCSSTSSTPLTNILRFWRSGLVSKNRWTILKLYLKGKIIFLKNSLRHPDTVSTLKFLNLQIGLHKTGFIYDQATIDCFELGILNPHIGMLPQYRGRCVMEWSLLQGSPTGVTTFFIDSGIDTGKRIVSKQSVDISHCSNIAEAKKYLFEMDNDSFINAIKLIQSNSFQYHLNDQSGCRYYVMSNLFLEICEDLLAKR